jgi:hypothetical protein
MKFVSLSVPWNENEGHRRRNVRLKLAFEHDYWRDLFAATRESLSDSMTGDP